MSDNPNNKNTYYVYRYIRLDTNTPFYVGKGKDNRANLIKEHSKWCQNIANKHGFEIEYIMEDLTEEKAFAKEKEFIKIYKYAGYELTNLTNGGEGISGYRHTEDAKNKISKRSAGSNNPNFGKSPSKQTREKQSISRKGWVPSVSMINAAILAHVGIPRSKETKAKISAGLTGEKHPMHGKTLHEEHKNKISIALKGPNNPNFGKSPSKQTREKMSSAKLGKTASIETKIKLSLVTSGKNNPNFGKIASKETREKQSKAQIGKPKPWLTKRIQCIETGQIFNSVKELSIFLGISPSDASRAVSKNVKNRKTGLTFKKI